ncbi:SDR family NAD(P)-dependent oxidoreductase [Variovorax ginsengisoli]|uniref:NAD(P)-dependent dehydrogenase (Short-subunit alcohol dehydrogenase family) n=1 Tax=Variovorax ginsengisoli TaxID=363844 RepID=A0ABT9SAS3_9BURK|nr:SDR family NAD(P)-dependent oxidoreductase [Variovorax ginsengisoli]MDP9900856.1 NAD(P)-dependent dehydrogenase (short-subunit alcohol dehydrogenase family) [Variovorax ginsengisoli]
MEYKDKVVMIVGASSGIGRTLALRLAGRGAQVVAMARREDKLKHLRDQITAQGGCCSIQAADAQDPAAALRAVHGVVAEHGRIDLLILNAGGAPAIDMRCMDATDVLAYMRSNYDVAVNVLFPVLNVMRGQRSGVVAVTNSLAGLLGVPLQGPYSAAKGALKLLIDTCRVEFAEFGIRFVSVYPGFISTQATAGDGMPAPLQMSEDRAVDHLLRALRGRYMDYAFPWPMAALVRLANMLPKRLVVRILRRDVPKLSSEPQSW